jgi:two-component system sensor histidine kinase KdpD
MIGSQGLFGVLIVSPRDPARFSDVADCRMLDTCASLIALSIERDSSRAEAHQALLQVQAESFRNALLSSVSHDMRTPLAMIAVTASGLMDDSIAHNEAEKREMLETVVDESNRLARQVDNLLEMARLNAGALSINRQWHVLEELLGVALSRLKPELQKYKVNVDIPGDFPLLLVADDLLGQVFVNLLENAVRYTPPGSRIDISARIVGFNAEIRFSDNGPGLPTSNESKVFELFFRGRSVVADGQRGMGIGLAICHGLVHAHGGSITASNRAAGGAEFVITLPCQQPAPRVDLDETAPAITGG